MQNRPPRNLFTRRKWARKETCTEKRLMPGYLISHRILEFWGAGGPTEPNINILQKPPQFPFSGKTHDLRQNNVHVQLFGEFNRIRHGGQEFPPKKAWARQRKKPLFAEKRKTRFWSQELFSCPLFHGPIRLKSEHS